MNWADYIILAVLGLSVLIGLWRGLISEVLGLLIWVAAAWLTWTFGPSVSSLYEHSISLPSARLAAGYGTCFVGVLVGGVIVRFLVGRLVQGTGLSGTDRLLGMLFGLARGVLVVTVGVFLVSLTALVHDPWWQQSTLLPQFKGVAAWLGDQVPGSARRFLQPSAVVDQLPALPSKLPELPSKLPELPSGLSGLSLPSQLPSLPAAMQGFGPASGRSTAGRDPASVDAAPREAAPANMMRDPASVDNAPRHTTHP